jgi:tetratricopeptide (TPR) repeat protein
LEDNGILAWPWKNLAARLHLQVGGVLSDKDDYDGALSEISETLAIVKPLADANPVYAAWQELMADAYNHTGWVLLRRSDGNDDGNDLVEALRNQKLALSIREFVAKSDPKNGVRKVELLSSFHAVGSVLLAQRNFSDAFASFEAGLELGGSRWPTHKLQWVQPLLARKSGRKRYLI